MPKYNIPVQLTGRDGNALMAVGTVARALRSGGVGPVEVKRFQEEALSGDYDHLLRTCMKWVEVS